MSLDNFLTFYPRQIDIDWIECAAKSRNQNGINRGWNSKTSTQDDSWNIKGIAGEWAAAMLLNQRRITVTGATKEELNQGDLLGFVEVKTASGPSQRDWNLIVNKDQLKQNRVYILVLTFDYPKALHVAGWALGSDIVKHARITLTKKTRHQIYLLPGSELNPILSVFSAIKLLGK